jgi:hypothetical protein
MPTNNKVLVEQCDILPVTVFKTALTRLRASQGDFEDEITSFPNNPPISYWVEHKDKDVYLTFSYEGKEPQTIQIVESVLTFGLRAYFLCPGCGRQVFKLYRTPRGENFNCFHCQNLRYEVTSFNRRSPQGELGYKMNRILKLMQSRELITNRIIYNGKFSRSYRNYLSRATRLGLNGPAIDAEEYLSYVKEITAERQRV